MPTPCNKIDFERLDYILMYYGFDQAGIKSKVRDDTTNGVDVNRKSVVGKKANKQLNTD